MSYRWARFSIPARQAPNRVAHYAVADALVWEGMDSSLSLPTPETFPIFPYDEPYDIQLNLMQHLYSAIEDKAVAVVESPTGTVNCN